MDLTHPEVKAYIKEVFERVFEEWGFDYIKIDFLIHGAVEGIKFDNTKTSAEAFREGMDIICKVAKDRFVLNCGSPMLQSVGACDGMRIGADVGARWYLPIVLDGWQYGNCAIKPALSNTLYRTWMHESLWQNDPDCIVVRDTGNDFEKRKLGQGFFGYEMTDKDFGLSEEEAMSWVRAVWFTRTMALLSEVWDELTEERKQMVLSCFPLNSQKVTLLDWYENPEVVILKTCEGPLMIGIFNMSDEEQTITLPSEKISCFKWQFVEHFSNEVFEGEGSEITFPKLSPRSARIWVEKSKG